MKKKNRNNTNSIPAFMEIKPKQLGFFEAKVMEFRGKRDGKKSIVKLDAQGEFRSPRTSQEQDALLEHESKLWGTTEINVTSLQAEADNVIRLLKKKSARLEELSERTDAKTEFERSMKELTIERLQDDIFQKNLRLAYLRSQIYQLECTTRLICQKAKNRVEQRLDAYWNGVLKKSSNPDIPPVPTSMRTGFAEEIYMLQHKAMNDAIDLFLENNKDI